MAACDDDSNYESFIFVRRGKDFSNNHIVTAVENHRFPRSGWFNGLYIDTRPKRRGYRF